MSKLNSIDWLSLVLLFVGGLNWGLVGFFDFDLVSAIFGQGALFSRLVFALVGVSSLYSLIATAPKIAGMEECADSSLMKGAGKSA